MTYCVGMSLEKGLVFMSDTRTNAGVDNVFVFKKMFSWEEPGERVITILTAGNLATTQAVVSLLSERTKAPQERSPSILEAPTMFQVARLVGDTLKETVQAQANSGPGSDATFSATLIVGGQIAGSEPRLFLIYPEGNFIEASAENPFFQTGETKYGRPILLRGYDTEMGFEEAIRLLCLSFDSTLKANLSVGMPLDVQVYERDSFRLGASRRIEHDDKQFNDLADRWGAALRNAIETLPPYKL